MYFPIHTLHICRRIAERVQEIFVNDYVAENTLIISIETFSCQLISRCFSDLLPYIKTVEAAIEIHTVSLSPEPPRYLRGMTTGGWWAKDACQALQFDVRKIQQVL